MTSPAVWGPSADCFRLDVQLHRRSFAKVGPRLTDEKRTSDHFRAIKKVMILLLLLLLSDFCSSHQTVCRFLIIWWLLQWDPEMVCKRCACELECRLAGEPKYWKKTASHTHRKRGCTRPHATTHTLLCDYGL